jgi:regulatory protein
MQKKRMAKEQALQKLRHYCRYQERCQTEARNKLFELGINKNEHDELILELARENYLNEERFAQAFVIGKFKIKEWGRKKIRYALKEKRVDHDVIERALEKINVNDYLESLQKLAKEKYESLKDEQYLVRKKRTMDYLMQKGYEEGLIKSSLDVLK